MSKTYNVLQSASYGQWVKVKANNKEEAIKKVNDGDWTDEDIVSSELVIRETTGDVEEVSDDL
tara:strand:- start:10139 stop:10327 length:189 start_codon:yes stop_codon:yes gene_type:complete